MEQRLSLVTVGVHDLARATAFYERLGWRRSLAGAEGVAFFQVGGIGLSLYPCADLEKDTGVSLAAEGSPRVSLAYNARTRDEVDSVMAEAEAADATVLHRPRQAEWGGYFGHFADPDGVIWEVAWNPAFPIAADGSITIPA